MKKLSLVFVAAMLLFTGNIFANNPEKGNSLKQLSVQIGELLENTSFTSDYVDLTAQVRFTLNKQGEIVVLSVDTDREKIEIFVKARLNYQKIEIDDFKEGEIYTIPIRIAGA
ncbi:hypothetical protein HZY62_01170 [Maribacter polysiphoniae]|uniref:Uncharacterized protein n=1 Tax=Maribacter polysiphoniae TaxID=429344 RepID=A0A316E5W0_9FLAO|nr:hypothetical protein [Maribacter polysiphoniae]MBD1259183.1 hypothetical protein [Maribacter polysiphoniae]PWK24739.1 hypothetical protein LX92_01104 [Maribacter polysiphoniae]